MNPKHELQYWKQKLRNLTFNEVYQGFMFVITVYEQKILTPSNDVSYFISKFMVYKFKFKFYIRFSVTKMRNV